MDPRSARHVDAVPISALQHMVFCPRQCALIHLEDQWFENRLTLEGKALHERVDETGRRHETRGDRRLVRRLELAHPGLGLVGRADMVELHRVETGGIALPGASGRWLPFPVEYKRGRPKTHDADRVQLCAQALCLETMLDVVVPAGALFYGADQRREAVSFDDRLRTLTAGTARAVHALFTSRRVPIAKREAKCRRCSLEPTCLPDLAARRQSARAPLLAAIRDAVASRDSRT